MQYLRQSSLKWILVYLVIGLAAYGAVYYFFFNQKTDWHVYRNTEYGFEITFPDSWQGFSVETGTWEGREIVDLTEVKETYIGPELIFKNPQTTTNHQWQNIPIMIFSHVDWGLVNGEKIAVSAAPIGPNKIGENSNYVFATPPRWYGFGGEEGSQEAVNIVATFKTLK